MIKIFNCRRSSLGLIGIACLTSVALYTKQDVSGIAIAISGIIASIAGANSYEKAKIATTQQEK